MLGEVKNVLVNNIVVGDADSLISLVHRDDIHHKRARNISQELLTAGYQVIYPNTAILEAITSLKRALNLPNKAHFLNRQYIEGIFVVEYIDEKLQQKASQIFQEKAVSKQNTIFDALVVATAEKFDAEMIFSFDKWYPKLGYMLTGKEYGGN